MSPRRLIVEADGGSRGNPGRAAYGSVVKDADTGEVLAERGEAIGIASNNVAEYRGLIAGLAAAHAIDPEARVEARLDSKLVVEQMSGRWQVKHPDMRLLAKEAFAAFPPGQVTYVWVPREENKHADRLVNAALDGTPVGTGVSATEGAAVARDVRAPLDAEPPSTRLAVPILYGKRPPDLGDPTLTILVRHGETAMTAKRQFSGAGAGTADPSLTDTGVAQARAAAAALRGGGVDAVVCSPLTRTRETAAVIAETLDVGEPEVVPDLREIAFGDWDGHTIPDVMRRWPGEWEAWLGSAAVAPPGGESLDALAARVGPAMAEVRERYASRTVVVVSHVTPIKVTVASVLGAPLASAVHHMDLTPASLTTIAWWSDGAASLRTYNVTP